MGKFKDLTGQRFGRLTVIERAENQGKKVCWRCKCDCGNETIVKSERLIKGEKKSCGCLLDEHFKDLTGQRFGKLMVVKRVENNKHNQPCWRCKCDCGGEVIVTGACLRSGNTISCGCWKKEKAAQNFTKHGKRKDKTYGIWNAIKQRCFNPNVDAYARYGGRGITICDEWRDNFQAFYDYVSQLEHYGEEGYSLDRIDNDGNYEPSNLRWATAKEQARNRRANTIVEYNGEKMTLAEATEKSCINIGTLLNRIKRGLKGSPLFLLPTNKK